MTTSGWMPGVTVRVSPNYTSGRQGQLVKAVCLHVTAGAVGHEYPNAISWLCDPQSQASAHFVISQTGDITQLVSIQNMAWSNGLSWSQSRGVWIDPEGNVVHPAWTGLVIPVNPNCLTIGVEHACQPNDVWSTAMFNANTRVLQWIAQQTGLVYQPRSSLIGHNEISPVSRPNCPGPNVNYAAVANAANAKPKTYTVFSTGTSYIRQGPGRSYPVVATLHQSDAIIVDTIVTGESIQGNNQWAHISSGIGFVTMTVLKEASSPATKTFYRVTSVITPLYRHPRARAEFDDTLLTQGDMVSGRRDGDWVRTHQRGRYWYIPIANLEEIGEE